MSVFNYLSVGGLTAVGSVVIGYLIHFLRKANIRRLTLCWGLVTIDRSTGDPEEASAELTNLQVNPMRSPQVNVEVHN